MRVAVGYVVIKVNLQVPNQPTFKGNPMSVKPRIDKIRNNRRYARVAIAFMLLLAGALIAKLPYTETVVSAAAKFLTSVAHNATLTGNGTASSPLSIASNGVGTSQIADGAVTAPKIASGQVVKNINGLTDSVTLAGGSDITITPTGNNTLTISASIPQPQSSPQPFINPLRVATLQWYEAIETGLEIPVGGGASQIASDGANIWDQEDCSDRFQNSVQTMAHYWGTSTLLAGML
jgi:hypothetical protein